MDKIDQHNIISSDMAKEIIRTSVQTLIDNPDLAESLPPILLRGAPGCGKSTIVKQIAKELGIGFVDVRLAEMERVDVCGLPSVDSVTGTSKWNVPAFWPQDPDSKGIILLDEITSAPQDCQVAAYQIVLDRAISNSNYKIPKGWFIVACGNRTMDRAVVKSMSSALANRFAHFEMEANPEDWIPWAVTQDIHPSVTGFIKFRPDKLFQMKGQNLEMGWPSPRSWERVSHILPLFNDETTLRKVVYGLVGDNVGVEFMEFHRINKNFGNILKMLTDPEAKITIPQKSDERYAMAAAVSYLIWNGKNEEDDKTRTSGMYRICMQMPADFATMIVKNAMLGNKRVDRPHAVQYIAHAKEYKDFVEKYGDSFNKSYSL